MSAFKYDAFISYRRSDGSTTARWIRRQLQSFRPPKRLHGEVKDQLKLYLDTAYERATNDFYEQSVRTALLDSRFLIVVATPDAQRREGGTADWIEREINDFSAGPNAGNIVVVRGKGEFDGPLPGNLAERFPNIEIIDLRGVSRYSGFNPLKSVRINIEKLKLIAPLIDLPAEKMPLLHQEEERQQQARLGRAAGIGLGVLIAVSSLSIFALYSRWQAERALTSSLFATGQIIQRVGNDLDANGPTKTLRSQILNEACDLMNKLSGDGTRRPRPHDVVKCMIERALELERQKELEPARDKLINAIETAETGYQKKPNVNTAFAMINANSILSDFYQRREQYGKAASQLARLLTISSRFSKKYDSFPNIIVTLAETQAALASWHQSEDRLKPAILYTSNAAKQAGRAAALFAVINPQRSSKLKDWQALLIDFNGQHHLQNKDRAKAHTAFNQSLLLRGKLKQDKFVQAENAVEAVSTLKRMANLEAAGSDLTNAHTYYKRALTWLRPVAKQLKGKNRKQVAADLTYLKSLSRQIEKSQ